MGIGLTALLALGGLMMAPISPLLFLAVAGTALVYYFALDGFKVRLFAWLALR